MDWQPFENGATIGQRGSEDGVVVRDDEHKLGARITLEQECRHAPFAITCGIYGWMFHTRYVSSRAEPEYESMLAGLADVLCLIPFADDPDADAKCQRVSHAIQQFVARFP